MVELRDRLPSAVEGKYAQLAEGYPDILAVIAGADCQFDEFEDFFIDTPVIFDITTGVEERGAPRGFFYHERTDSTKINTKLGAVIMWKDQGRRYIRNPYADIMINEDLLNRIIA